jgi:hypothetical protein
MPEAEKTNEVRIPTLCLRKAWGTRQMPSPVFVQLPEQFPGDEEWPTLISPAQSFRHGPRD